MEETKETKEMKELIEMLKNPLTELNSVDLEGFRKKCSTIADKLIHNFGIECGHKKYRFAEIEFYYYDGNKSKFSEEWNEKTYARNKKNAGELFFHYSGVDICFKSDFDKKSFGGILIRSLVERLNDGTERYITGPILCVNEILNNCTSHKGWPKLIETDRRECEIFNVNRYGIEYKKNPNFEDGLCFYDKNLEGVTSTKFKDISWDYKTPKSKDLTRYYKRFAYKHLVKDNKNDN